MFDDPKVVSAIIAGTVSLTISATVGIYTVIQNRKKFDVLRNEILVKASTESFIQSKETYLDAYRKFEPEVVSINQDNPHDGTKVLQFLIDFHATKARDYYLRNRSFLNTKELDYLYEEITSAIESGSLNDSENHDGKREFGNNLLSFFSKLHEKTLSANET